MARNRKKTLKNKSGQGTIEYILILGFAITTATLLSKTLKSAWHTGTLKLGGQMEQALKTGRTPYSAWKN